MWFVSTKTAHWAATLAKKHGYNVTHDQKMDAITRPGGADLDLLEYAKVLELDSTSAKWLSAFMSNWHILRQCCGHESSTAWRLELHGLPPILEDYSTHGFANCRNYNLSQVELTTQTIVSSLLFGESMRQEMSMYTGNYCAVSNAKIASGIDPRLGEREGGWQAKLKQAKAKQDETIRARGKRNG
jgi:hypothetical protein